MHRDYKLAAYALAAAAVVLLASGALVAAGTGTDAPAGDAAPDGENATANETDAQALNLTVSDGDEYDLTFVSGEGACGGALRAESPNRTETEVALDDVTVTLVERSTDEPFDGIDRERVAELAWDAAADRADFETDRVEVRVTRYYESLDREEPLDTAGIRVRPVDGCLPTVAGELDLANETVDVRSVRPQLDDLDLAFTDEIGVLDADDEALIEDLVVADESAAYDVQTQFDDPDELDATVLEATNDGRVEVELTAPGTDGQAVVVTVDLDDETVVDSWTRISFDSVDVASANETDGNVTVHVTTNGTEAE